MSLRRLLQQQLHRRGLLEDVVDGDGEGVEKYPSWLPVTILSRLLFEFEEGQFLSKVWVSQDPRDDEDLDILGTVAGEVFEDGKVDNQEGWGERAREKSTV